MALTLKDRFVVRAPIEDVWAFLIDPKRIAPCMPGAHLERVESERVFHGRIKIAVGPFSTSYRGRVEFTELDPAWHTAHLKGEGQERDGGAAQATMFSSLTSVPDGTEVFVDVSVDGANKIVKMGLNLTENLANVLFAQFVACVKQTLESPHAPLASSPVTAKPVQVVPLLAKGLVRRFRNRKVKK